MENKKNYNRVNALIYELIIFLEQIFSGLTRNKLIQRIKDNCQDDWTEFRVLLFLEELDKETAEVQKKWKEEEQKLREPVYTELPPDGSNAQDLLGGEMRLTSPWMHDKPEP
jgi:adenylosuccinate lyase